MCATQLATVTRKGTTMNDTSTARQPRKRGAKPKDAGGRRSLQARATLNGPERARHEAWLRTQGWPSRPEADIVREALAVHWPSAA